MRRERDEDEYVVNAVGEEVHYSDDDLPESDTDDESSGDEGAQAAAEQANDAENAMEAKQFRVSCLSGCPSTKALNSSKSC